MTMRSVRMLISISGSRHDGRDWREFPAGSVLTCPDWEASLLVRGRQAVEVPAEEMPPPAPPPPVTEDEHDRLELVADGAAEPQGAVPEPAGNAVPDAVDEIVPRPADPKRSWVDYAVSKGADPAAAAAMTKEALQSAYGGRL